jgi:hypothetical protein
MNLNPSFASSDVAPAALTLEDRFIAACQKFPDVTIICMSCDSIIPKLQGASDKAVMKELKDIPVHEVTVVINKLLAQVIHRVLSIYTNWYS